MVDRLKLVSGDDGQYTPRPPGGGDMENRLTKLETRLDTILPTIATKADVSESKASIVMWVAGVVAASTAIIVTVSAFMLNRAVPVQPTQQQAPIVVYPAQPASPPAPQSPPATKRGP